MKRASATMLATLTVGLALATSGCAEHRTTVRRETETVRSQPRVVEERSVVTPPAADEETTVIERHRRTTEEDH
jgi:hypothetical protein